MANSMKRLAFFAFRPSRPILRLRASPSRVQRPLSRGFATRISEKSSDEDDDQILQRAGLTENEIEDLKALAARIENEVPDLDDLDAEMPKDEDFKSENTFWGYGEPDIGPDEEFQGDDMTSLGHQQLQRHRELREYARVAAWELPLLSKYARPFKMPAPDQFLRFRYTSYLGEKHPAEKKVVLEFCPGDIPDLTDIQKSKLIKLCGPRYNPSTEIVKMSCEMFETQAQNKRYLGDTIDNLLSEAKDPTDTFEDVPFDFRHRKIKRKERLESYKFPDAWAMTTERKVALDARRNTRLLTAKEKSESGKIIDGLEVISQSIAENALDPALETIAVRPAQRGRRIR